MSMPDTDQLILLAKSGDQSAQQCLLSRHRERLKRMVDSMLDPRISARVDASDVLQEALIRASKKLPGYLQEQPVAFYPWIRQIVREILIDTHRRHLHADRRSVFREDRLDIHVSDDSAMKLAYRLTSREPSPSQLAGQRDIMERVKRVMIDLSSEDRELLLMRFDEQLRTSDMAAILAVSDVTVRSRLRRAIERLGRLVFQQDGPPP
jgi:RNA polymerase sigma-70 factor (ECF subfamily)